MHNDVKNTIDKGADVRARTAYIVPSPHWDGEWYWSKERFRIRLVQLIDDLVEIFDNDPEYKYHMLDGQTAPLEDYLEIKPWMREKLRRLVTEGRLIIGPWYLQPDTFLASGESIIRNLIIGEKMGKEFGGNTKIGYLPDSFGHIDQLPQILRSVNIHEFFFTRGMGEQLKDIGTEFLWKAPDGSVVYTTYLTDGYYAAGGLGFEDPFTDFRYQRPDPEIALRKITAMLEKMKHDYPSDTLLLFNGSDHTNAQKELPELLRYLNEKIPDVDFRFSTLREYLTHRNLPAEHLPVYTGEFTGQHLHVILRSVYSSRMYMKQANFHCQSMLEKYAEPLSAVNHVFSGAEYSDTIDHAWKILVQNHPHDCITGCSIDQVHRDVMNRYDKVREISDYVMNKSFEEFSRNFKTNAVQGEPILFFNPNNAWFTGVVTSKVSFPGPVTSGGIAAKYKLVNDNSEEVPFAVSRIYQESVIELNDWKTVYVAELKIVLSLPPLGCIVCYLVAGKQKQPASLVTSTENTLENEYYRVRARDNGSLSIYEKESGKEYHDFNVFEDTEDDGDEYTYSFVEDSQTITSRDVKAKISLAEISEISGTLKIEIDLRLPSALDSSRTKRTKKLVTNRIVSFVTVNAGSRRIDITTEIENKAKDHRLRAVFKTGFAEYINHADGHFGIVERKKHFPEKPTERGKVEYYATQHQTNFTTLSCESHGVTIANKGLPEYEILKDDSTIAITLLRCVGWLNKNNLMTRWRMAGPNIPTPDAQCLGRQVAEYAIILHTNDNAASYREAYAFCFPVFSKQIAVHEGQLRSGVSLFELPPNVVVSAIKIAEDRNGFVVRLFNITNEVVHAKIRTILPHAKCCVTDSLENSIAELAAEDGCHRVEIGAHKIVTLLYLKSPLH
jgi:mannosylglycerate hydrolase